MYVILNLIFIRNGAVMTKLKIQSIKPTKTLNYLHGFNIDYTDKTGKNRIWEFVSRAKIDRLKDEILNGASYSDGATIFACNRQKDKVVLIKEYRVSQGRYIYALPAGLIDAGETVEQAAIREFKEETGMTFLPIKIDTERYSSVGITNEKVNFVYGYFDGEPKTDYTADNEDITPFIADKDTVIKLLSHNEVPIRTALVLENFFNLNSFFD